jgi:hypothetical protein
MFGLYLIGAWRIGDRDLDIAGLLSYALIHPIQGAG